MTAASYNKIRRLPGWFAYTDFELFRAIFLAQHELGISGSVIEIGVHHGKSFIPLCHFSNDAQCYAIDVFDNQDLNHDGSGRGDLAAFKRNLVQFSVPMSRITIDQRLSSEVKADDIFKAVGPARFFHIDGGHHLDAILSDLALAVNTSADGAVIVVDDVFRPEWPEVSAGVFQSDALRDHGFITLACGFNKLFLCQKDYLTNYQAALSKMPSLATLKSKTYAAKHGAIMIYQNYPLPEWNWRQFLSWYLKVYMPGLFTWLKS